MSGVTHTVHITEMLDVGNTTEYYGHVTYLMSETVLFAAIRDMSGSVDNWTVHDENGETVTVATETNIIRHIKHTVGATA